MDADDPIIRAYTAQARTVMRRLEARIAEQCAPRPHITAALLGVPVEQLDAEVERIFTVAPDPQPHRFQGDPL